MDQGVGAGHAGKAYCWTFGNAEFDEARWQLRVAGQDVELEHKPLEVLQYLLRHAGEAVASAEAAVVPAAAARLAVEMGHARMRHENAQHILSVADMAIIATDGRGVITESNRCAESLFGYERQGIRPAF